MADFLNITLILVAGTVAVAQDLTIHKVRNWLVVSVLAVYLALLLTGVLTISPWPYKVVLINIAIGAICSISMWQFEIWPAGDAKLFILFTVLLPLGYYVNGPIMYFPAMALLLNIFCLGALFLCLKIVLKLAFYLYSIVLKREFFKTMRKGGALALKGLPSFLNTMLFIMLTYIVARLVGDYLLGLGYSLFKSLAVFQFLIVFLLYRRLVTFFRSRLVMTTCLLVLSGLIFMKFALLKFDSSALFAYMIVIFRMTLYSIMAIQVIISVFDLYIKVTQVYEIAPGELEPWVIIDKESVLKVLKEKGVTMKFTADGIDPEDVEKLKKILPPDYKIKAHKTFPFAPFIAAGVLLTMILKMSLLHIVMAYMRAG